MRSGLVRRAGHRPPLLLGALYPDRLPATHRRSHHRPRRRHQRPRQPRRPHPLSVATAPSHHRRIHRRLRPDHPRRRFTRRHQRLSSLAIRRRLAQRCGIRRLLWLARCPRHQPPRHHRHHHCRHHPARQPHRHDWRPIFWPGAPSSWLYHLAPSAARQ